MISRRRLLITWGLGALVLLGAFYAAIVWLWSAVEESRAASLEREVVSVLGNDLAEGNLFKLGQSLSKLQQEGHLRSAEIRDLGRGEGGDLLFRTRAQGDGADAMFSGFECSQQRKIVRHGEGVGLITTIPSALAGTECVALFINADLPEDLRRFKNRLMAAFGLTFVAFFALFVSFTMSGYRKILDMEVAAKAALGKIAAQVAHDIRSPLAALDAVIKDVSQLPEEKRLIVRSAVSRIRDIANDLIEKNRDSQAPSGRLPVTNDASASVELLSSHVDPLITEKRLQFRPRIGIEIEGRLEASYGLFAKIQPADFKRVLSNLINNSVEAMGENGLVVVQLMVDSDRILVKVTDNAGGIPRDILAKLGQRGVTCGKAGGSGLGLYHAKSCVESWGGRLSIESETGKGTAVTIELPKAASPEWFVSRIELTAGGTVVVLDDDASIHQIWQGRFESLRAKDHGIEVAHFSTPDGLRQFLAADPAKARTALCLIDYEFMGHKETGLGLIDELDIGERSILITSRAEEESILAECRRLKVRMIPKGMAGFVPVSITPRRQTPDAVLLDNDALVHMTWKIVAESKGVNLLCFRTAQDLLCQAERLSKSVAIYADSELGNGIQGEDIAKELHAKGFTNLYLTTGHSPETFPPMPWIKQVRGKEPPWADTDA
ncbi:MAG: HAMP domain-containing sensor histidine kinase [Elusimicrobiota bacterium]